MNALVEKTNVHKLVEKTNVNALVGKTNVNVTSLGDRRRIYGGCARGLYQATTWTAHDKTHRRTCAALFSKAIWKKRSDPLLVHKEINIKAYSCWYTY